jgi:hypothetical protein
MRNLRVEKGYTKTSVADPRHFGPDPDSRIHTSNYGSGPAIFVNDLQDANINYFFCLLLFEDKKS